MIKVQTANKISETSSKGNQEKWFENNRWYKLDNFGYEALSETVISKLINQTNIKNLGFAAVSYNIEKLEVHNHQRIACSSENFLKPNQSLITLAKLFRQCIGPDWQTKANKKNSIEGRIEWIIEKTKELTKLERFDEYLTLLFELDLLFCNEDRHLNNIAIIKNESSFVYCPFFDFGAGLLSNVRDYPLDILPSTLLKQLKANPMNTTFTRQVHAIEKLTGPKLETNFTEGKIMQALEPALEYYPKLYVPYIRERVLTCIKTQTKKLLS